MTQRILTSATGVLALCLLAAVLPAAAQSLRTAQLLRLPPVEGPGGPPRSDLPPPDVVQFAAGAVQFQVPSGWWIWELPAGREIRLAVSPTRPPSLTRAAPNGLWMCYHVAPPPGEDPQAELARWLARRLQLATGGGATVDPPRPHRLGKWPAIEQEVRLPGDPQTAGTPAEVRGSHVLVRTSWGVFEMHARIDPVETRRSWQEQAAILGSLRLGPPRLQVDPAGRSAVGDAAPLLGSWKSYRSRLRLRGNGVIEILTDAAELISPPDDAFPRPQRELLAGRYQANADLLFVEWDDGSKLNFRWQLREGSLLLTDHEGRISQLQRLYE